MDHRDNYFYSISCFGLPVGNAELSWYSGQDVVYFVGSMKTNTFADLIFSVENFYWSVIDEMTGNLLGSGSQINQANLSCESKDTLYTGQSAQADIFSMFNSLRWIEAAPGDSIGFELYEEGARYLAAGTINRESRQGEICMTLSFTRIERVKERLSSDLLHNHFADEGNIWHFKFSNDSNRIPLYIDFRKGSITVRMKLKENE